MSRPCLFAGELVLLAWVCAACSSATIAPDEPNPLRHALEHDLAAIDRSRPLDLRFNPAPCNCPVFELQVGQRWVRAELARSEGDTVSTWLAWLSASPIEALPVAVSLRGRVEREVLRSAQGAYAVRIDVSEILGPKPASDPPPITPPMPPEAP